VPVLPVPDEPDSILDYLVLRTGDTIGARADRSDAVVVGVVAAKDTYDSVVADEDVPIVRAWLSGEFGPPKLTVHRATIQVEEWILGLRPTHTLELASVSGRGPSPTERMPLLSNGDRALLFLNGIPADLPYARYLHSGSYQLAQGETALRKYPIAEHPDSGETRTRDESAAVQECVAAVRWYAALPKGEAERLHASLLAALPDRNPRIARYAVRRLAQLGESGTANRFRELLPAADDSMRTRLMLGFYVLGERDEAYRLLREAYRDEGEESWLGRWGLRRSFTEDGRYTGTLFGPDPGHVKGD